jgi:hypothetical protein
VLRSVARRRLVKTEKPSACGTVNRKLCKSEIALYPLWLRELVTKVLINQIIRYRTRYFRQANPPTRGNMETNNRSKAVSCTTLVPDMHKMVSITGCLRRKLILNTVCVVGLRSQIADIRIRMKLALDLHTTPNFVKKEIRKEWKGVLHWNIHIFQMLSLPFCLHQWPRYLLQKRIYCWKRNRTINNMTT